MRGSFINRRILQRFRQLTNSGVGSIRIKLLLCCCIVFTLVVIAGRAASFMGWKHHKASLRGFSSPRKGYTILINTWKRNDLLKQSISHYTSCAGLDSIRIVWSEPDPPSVSLRKYLLHTVQSNSRGGRDIELKFDLNTEDSLNNRFKEIKDSKTDAIFSIDDDIVFPCSSVEFAFSVWQSAPDTMVGFVPRIHWVDRSVLLGVASPKGPLSLRPRLMLLTTLPVTSLLPYLHKKGRMDHFTYGGWWSVWWMGTYSMVLSKAAFFHKKYLDVYTNQMPASIRDYVTKNRNCEDIAMSFLVANATGAPPLWVKGKIFEIGSTGISSLGGHSEHRSQCINKFTAEYGHMPLVSTSVKAVDSRNNWFW